MELGRRKLLGGMIAAGLAVTGSRASAGIVITKPRARVVVDPGHGGIDSGCVLRDKKGRVILEEKNLVLANAKILARVLTNMGFEAVLTRNDDTYLDPNERRELIRSLEPDYVYSLHIDSSAIPGAFSVRREVHINDDNEKFIGLTLVEMKKAGFKLRMDGDKPFEHTLNLAVLRVDAPAVCLELCSIRDAGSIAALMQRKGQERMASALCAAICRMEGDEMVLAEEFPRPALPRPVVSHPIRRGVLRARR